MNRADVEISVTIYLNSTRSGGDTFRPALSWEQFATYPLISTYHHCLSALIPSRQVLYHFIAHFFHTSAYMSAAGMVKYRIERG